VYSEHRNVSAVTGIRTELGRCSAFDITEDSFPNDATDDGRSGRVSESYSIPWL
jgi:hypothetical protein